VAGFDAARDAMSTVAAKYLAQDDDYYAKFGWMKGDVDKVAKPPAGAS
jgi:hypothetical protein